jgi:hypothetical protein
MTQEAAIRQLNLYFSPPSAISGTLGCPVGCSDNLIQTIIYRIFKKNY